MPQRTSAKSAASRRTSAGRSEGKNICVQSEEECLRLEIEELDKTDPDWYEPNLIARAKQLLQDGNKAEDVAAIYGERITAEAGKQRHKDVRKPLIRTARAASANSPDKVIG